MSTWQPSTSISVLRHRALMLKAIRAFFEARGYLEVETPVLTRYGITDVYIQQIKAHCLNQDYYLHTSPEYAMKRLLAAGSGPIFQLAKVFRDEELGRWHNPEFTLLEWYQLDIDHHALMQEVDIFLQHVLKCPPLVKKTYQAAFETFCGINPHTANVKDLKHVLHEQSLSGILPEEETDLDQYLFLLMSHVIEPAFKDLPYPVALYDFPPSQAALSRIMHARAARFEIYYQGLELANGFYELTDAVEQVKRFEQDRRTRLNRGLPGGCDDAYLLAALNHGLPACSGAALGVDRLIALAVQKNALSEVLAFSFDRI